MSPLRFAFVLPLGMQALAMMVEPEPRRYTFAAFDFMYTNSW